MKFTYSKTFIACIFTSSILFTACSKDENLSDANLIENETYVSMTKTSGVISTELQSDNKTPQVTSDKIESDYFEFGTNKTFNLRRTFKWNKNYYKEIPITVNGAGKSTTTIASLTKTAPSSSLFAKGRYIQKNDSTYTIIYTEIESGNVFVDDAVIKNKLMYFLSDFESNPSSYKKHFKTK